MFGASGTDTNIVPNPTHTLTIGQVEFTPGEKPYYLNGMIDDVRIYNRALSASEIQQLYNIGRQLAAITINGPSTVSAGSVTPYTCIAYYSDGSSQDVSALTTWSTVDSTPSGTSLSGNYLVAGTAADYPITIRAQYSSGGETRSATNSVTIQPVFSASISTANSQYNCGSANWTVTLTAFSSGPNGAATSYNWDLDGDGIKDDASGAQVIRTYMARGTVLIGVEATDSAGAKATANRYLTL